MHIEYDFKKDSALYFNSVFVLIEVLVLALWIFAFEDATGYYVIAIAIMIGLICSAYVDTISLKRTFEVNDEYVKVAWSGGVFKEKIDKLQDVEFYGEEDCKHRLKLTFKNGEKDFTVKTINLSKMTQEDRGELKKYFANLELVK